MHLLPTLFTLFASTIHLTRCDFLGLAYPPPRDLTSSKSLVRGAWAEASKIFDAGLKEGKNTSATQDLLWTKQVTFSSGLFSLHDAAATDLQYHYTGPQIANSKQGVQKVDADSIYRVASITKLITVLLGMVKLSDEDWNRPITDIIPEFAEGLNDQSPKWDTITLWALASHQAGLTATGVFNDLYGSLALSAYEDNTTVSEEAAALGLPPPGEPLTPCAGALCTMQQFVTETRALAPVFGAYSCVEYSDVGLMVLGMAISRVIGLPYDQMYQDVIFGPLGMTSSLANAPLNGSLFDRSVIVNETLANTFTFPYDNPTLPSGGILSTITDLQTLGVALLNSTLLSPDVTRRWMKPQAHTASMSYSIGAPWEITRYVHKSSGKVTDIYAKLGDSGAYGGMLALIPEYGAGFTMLNALYETAPASEQIRGEAALVLINHIAEAIIPALEAQATVEATSNFAGTYTSSDPAVNSSIEIAFDKATVPDAGPSLSITSWISNDIDMINAQFGAVKPRLLLSIPQEQPGGGNITFRATSYSQFNSYSAGGFGPYTGFYDSNWDTYAADGSRYVGGSLKAFTFEVDEGGAAIAVSNGATRVRMDKS